MNFIWNQKLGDQNKPYARRWVLDLGLFSIRLHHWYCGDDKRAFHDHAWDFITFVIKGSYVDVSPQGREPMPRWTVKYRKAEHKHTVETDGCWTIVLTGPEKRLWGFWVKNKTGKDIWFKAKRYFLKYKHHQCD